MKKTALELITELNEKHQLWESALKQKRLDYEAELKINKESLEYCEAGIGYRLGEGHTDKVKTLKKEKKAITAAIEEIQDNLIALQRASGVRNYLSDLNNIWKLLTQEYREIAEGHNQAEARWEEYKEKVVEYQGKASAARSQMTDFSLDMGSYTPIIKFAATLSKIYDNPNIIGKELQAKWQGVKPETLPDNWRLSPYAEVSTTLSRLLHDCFGKIAANEISDKAPDWK